MITNDNDIQKLPEQSGEYLFEFTMRRQKLRSAIMTSNRSLDEWGKLIGDVPTSTAILDSPLHRVEIMQITGKSYGLKDRARMIREACQGNQNGKKDKTCQKEKTAS